MKRILGVLLFCVFTNNVYANNTCTQLYTSDKAWCKSNNKPESCISRIDEKLKICLKSGVYEYDTKPNRKNVIQK